LPAEPSVRTVETVVPPQVSKAAEGVPSGEVAGQQTADGSPGPSPEPSTPPSLAAPTPLLNRLSVVSPVRDSSGSIEVDVAWLPSHGELDRATLDCTLHGPQQQSARVCWGMVLLAGSSRILLPLRQGLAAGRYELEARLTLGPRQASRRSRFIVTPTHPPGTSGG
jgi:hypothetical protein